MNQLSQKKLPADDLFTKFFDNFGNCYLKSSRILSCENKEFNIGNSLNKNAKYLLNKLLSINDNPVIVQLINNQNINKLNIYYLNGPKTDFSADSSEYLF